MAVYGYSGHRSRSFQRRLCLDRYAKRRLHDGDTFRSVRLKKSSKQLKPKPGDGTAVILPTYGRIGHEQSVLVVEDEPFIRMSTIALLEDAGLRVLEAGNSAEALCILEQHAKIRVLVTDVRMPGAMDGLSLVSRVRRDYPAIRTLVVSGNARAAEAYSSGAASFIIKPYLSHDLVAAVLSLVPQNQVPLGFVA
jgi:two-component system, response regulator PdtaR